jgi:hypothetical protein
LGPDEAARAWVAGGTEPVEDAIALALEVLAAVPQAPTG